MGINEKRKKYNSIISNLNDALAGLVGRSQKDIQENNRKINPVSGTAPPNCGSMKWNPTPDQDTNKAQAKRRRKRAQDGIESIIDELTNNKIEFPDAQDMLPPKKSSPGTGSGDMIGMLEVPQMMGKPMWFKEIIGSIGEMIGKPERGRKGIDYESAQTYIEQGVMITRKPRAKISKPNKEIYILMDQSGSMGQSAYKGLNFLELLGSYIPLLAKDYEGWFWVCDDCNVNDYETDETLVPKKQVKLDKVTKSIVMHGGGGTEFGGAFMKLGDIERDKKASNPKYEMCVIFFSDMDISRYEFDIYNEYGPTKIIFVTTTIKVENLRPHQWIWKDKNHKVVQVEMDITQ